MLFKKVSDDLGVGVYLGITADGDKVCFEVCNTSNKIIFVDGDFSFEKVSLIVAYYAPFPEIEYEG